MPDWRPILRCRADGNPRIMGILNITPDSFHSNSRYNTVELATDSAISMSEEGAEWIDIGGESTRPGAIKVDTNEEILRIVPVIEAIRDELPDIGISVDTRKSLVAQEALRYGADMINDISSIGDPKMIDAIDLYNNQILPACKIIRDALYDINVIIHKRGKYTLHQIPRKLNKEVIETEKPALISNKK